MVDAADPEASKSSVAMRVWITNRSYSDSLARLHRNCDDLGQSTSLLALFLDPLSPCLPDAVGHVELGVTILGRPAVI
jgi:hypothetical protein